MKCDYCDKKATVFLTQLADEQMKKVCLCASCAKERGVTDPTGFSLADMLLGNFQKELGAGVPERKQKVVSGGKTCPQCGFSYEDFVRVRRFGCGGCYKVFSEELGGMLQGMHKGTSHVGKVPDGLMEAQVRRQRQEELAARLELAISSESYEEAADLRDQLRAIGESEVAT